MKTKPRTQASIAEELGISRQTLSAWKRGGMDTTEANLSALKERAGMVSEKSATTAEIQAARLRKLRAEAESKEHALAVEKGLYILRSDAVKAGSRAGLASKHAWENIEDSLPPMLEGLTALQMKEKLRDYARSVNLELAAVFDDE